MIRTRDLCITLGEFRLRDINLEIGENEFFVLMGPTGAGKTVLLEAVAGLVPVKSGSIAVDGRDVTSLPPEKRGISIVYQDYCLFPHMNVRENINYGLKFHRSDPAGAARRFDDLVSGLDLTRLLDRDPATLSGGELQRVALARALVVDPAILLLDEPLSALDPSFREEIRLALKALHQTTRTTFVMVTHDLSEALSLADRAAIMNNGAIEQTGTIEDIFKRPESAFAADFVGMKNVFQAHFAGSTAHMDGLEIEMGHPVNHEAACIAIRPEDIILSPGPLTSSMRNSFPGRITAILDHGFFHEVRILSGNTTFRALVTKGALLDLNLHESAPVYLSFKSTAIHVFG